ncbi:MAG: sugar phosphate nucleotidyltransferase, partial [Patescibacteria group bacterium]
MSISNRCTKAVIAVAGFGTRRLPITKALEKCLIPIGNRPIVDYIVEDCL